MHHKQLYVVAVIALVFFTFLACATVGPETVKRDRPGYNDAVAESMKAQMLLNMVKLRYGDMPLFLDVSSIINSYALEGTLDLSTGFTFGGPEVDQKIGAEGFYADKPTITYSPLVGEKFTKSLLIPIPPESIFFLVQAGVPVDFVFLTCVDTINGVSNRKVHGASIKPADPQFYELMRAFRTIQDSGAMDIHIGEEEGKEKVLLFISQHVPMRVERSIDTALRILKLSEDRREFSLVYARLPKSDGEIAILSRSMYNILRAYSADVQVPEVHVTEKRAAIGAEVLEIPHDLSELYIKVYSSEKKPEDDFVAVNYHGYWFWIEDTDIVSKNIFSFILLLFTLAGSEQKVLAPVITVPAG
jgi:hypothetical protein